jgi:hypothetical protein
VNRRQPRYQPYMFPRAQPRRGAREDDLEHGEHRARRGSRRPLGDRAGGSPSERVGGSDRERGGSGAAPVTAHRIRARCAFLRLSRVSSPTGPRGRCSPAGRSPHAATGEFEDAQPPQVDHLCVWTPPTPPPVRMPRSTYGTFVKITAAIIFWRGLQNSLCQALLPQIAAKPADSRLDRPLSLATKGV